MGGIAREAGARDGMAQGQVDDLARMRDGVGIAGNAEMIAGGVQHRCVVSDAAKR